MRLLAELGPIGEGRNGRVAVNVRFAAGSSAADDGLAQITVASCDIQSERRKGILLMPVKNG